MIFKILKVIEIVNNDDDGSILTTKTQDELLALLLKERQKSKSSIDCQAAGTNTTVSGPTANDTTAGATGTALVAAEGSHIPTSTGKEGRVDGGLVGE